MVRAATNSSHEWSAAICIPNKRKNVNKKLARASNVSIGILNTHLPPKNVCVHMFFLKGGVSGTCFFPSASQSSGTIET